MLEPKEFFALEKFEHRMIFREEEAVWSALDRLQDYLAALFQGSKGLAGVTGQVERPHVIFEEEIRQDAEIKSTGPKGSLQAYRDGALLEGASIVLAGAYLADDRIRIGSLAAAGWRRWGST